jgi:hypothetical protein
VSEGFAALVAGDRARKIDDADALCDELQTLAAHHEALRTRDGGAS